MRAGQPRLNKRIKTVRETRVRCEIYGLVCFSAGGGSQTRELRLCRELGMQLLNKSPRPRMKAKRGQIAVLLLAGTYSGSINPDSPLSGKLPMNGDNLNVKRRSF